MFWFEHVLIPAGRQQGADGRFTHFTAVTLAVFLQQFVEGLDAFHADQMVQLLARVSEVLAQVVVHFNALFCQLGVQHLGDQRDTAAAAGPGFGFRLQRRNGVAAFVNGGDQHAFGDVEAGTDLRAVRQFIHTDGRLTAGGVRREDQRVRVFRQLNGVQHQLEQVAEVAGVAHQHRPEQGFVVLADDKTFVDFFAFVQINIAAGVRGATMRIANTAHVHAQQLQLGAHVCAGEGVFAAQDMIHGDLRHFVPRRDQAEYAVVPAGAFADGVDIRIGGLAGVVNHDPAALRDGQAALRCQLVARADTGGEDDEVHFQLAAVGKAHGFACFSPFLNDLFGVFAGVNFHAHAFDLTAQLIATHVVELFGHQHRGKFDNVGFNAEVFQRACRFQTQQTTADNRAAFASTCAGFNGVEVFNGTVNEAILGFRPFNRRDPRIRARRHDQLIVKNRTSGAGVDYFLLTVDGDSAFAHQHFYAMLLVEPFTHQRELFGGMVREVGRQVHTVVRLAGFFTEHGNIELLSIGFIEKILNKAVADHAVTDDSESDFAHFCLDFFSITAYLNDSAGALIDANQIRLHLPLRGYIYDLSGFL